MLVFILKVETNKPSLLFNVSSDFHLSFMLFRHLLNHWQLYLHIIERWESSLRKLAATGSPVISPPHMLRL